MSAYENQAGYSLVLPQGQGVPLGSALCQPDDGRRAKMHGDPLFVPGDPLDDGVTWTREGLIRPLGVIKHKGV